MMRLPRIVSLLALVFSLSIPIAIVRADDTATPGTPGTPGTSDSTATPTSDQPTTDQSATDTTTEQQAAPTLADLADNFWHYGKIARYDLASDAGEKIAAGSDAPLAVLDAFEAVAANHHDSIDTWLLRWRTLPVPSDADVNGDAALLAQQTAIKKMRAAADKLTAIINRGYAARSGDPNFIHATIVAMAQGQRAYDNNMPRLAKSGELAVKVLVDILRDPSDREYNSTARRALRDLGRRAINPLLAATEMKDNTTLLDVVSALGDIKYDTSIPYLAKLAADPNRPDGIHVAARRALAEIGVTDATLTPADQFFVLGEKFYYGQTSIMPAGDQISYVWFWANENEGLTKLDIPTPIFGDCMAMRQCEYALKLDPQKSGAVSLWLAANTKREADLPTGATDPSHADVPDAHYYNVSAGVMYLNEALARAIRDRNAAVAFKLTTSLQDIIGPNNLSTNSSEPLIRALYFPNRQVRYQAAFALAASLPSRLFPGCDRVVPLLAAALSQTSRMNVLVVAPADNSHLSDLRTAALSTGAAVAVAADPTQAVDAATALPTIDAIVISEDSDVRRMIDLSQTSVELQGAPIIVLTRSTASPYAVSAAADRLINAVVEPPKDAVAATLKTELPKALQRAGTPLMTDEQATSYARRAAQLLANLALCRAQVLDLVPAEPGVLTALSDSRADIAMAAGRVLAMLDSPVAQNGLAAKAIDDHTPAEVRVSLFKSLATNAKFFGNRLDSAKVESIETIVASEKNSDVRAAAAEARGALNLPADQARALILSQSKM